MSATATVPLRVTRASRRTTPRWWRDLAGVLTWASALVVVALWLSGGGITALQSHTSEQLTTLGRATGLVAADLLLVQVLLMARVPFIERSYGQDELARRHRLVGFWSFNLLIVHLVLITIGYAMADRLNVVQETWHFLSTSLGLLLSYAGTAALVLVTVTSIRWARRRLRYESWHLLHLYAYVGVGLSVPHEIWSGADFQSSHLAQVYWWSAYAVCAGAVVVFRLGMPTWRTLRHGIRVTAVHRENDDVVTVRMGGRGLHKLPARAGQFFVFRFLDGPGWSRGNPYSLSAAPRHDHLQITAKDLGDGSRRLAGLRPGTRVLIEGPYGRLTGEHRRGSQVVMLACGIGITPMRALLEDLDYAPGKAVLVYRARTEPDLVFRDELQELAEARGVTIHHLVGPRIPGRESWLPMSARHLTDAEALRRLVPGLADSDVFVCGPDAWMDAAVRAARTAGVPSEQLHVERFSW